MKSCKLKLKNVVMVGLMMCLTFLFSNIYIRESQINTAPPPWTQARQAARNLEDGPQGHEPEFPDDLKYNKPVSKEALNAEGRKILIRKPKGRDLDPVPINLGKSELDLGLQEIPARRPPGCILLGFAKCGTSAILEFIDLHPKIAALHWEPDYFCDRMYPKYDLQWYVRRMPPSFPDQVTIEKSPCYIVEHDSHIRMHAMNSSLKVMVIVRDPVTRIMSEYGHYSATERYWGRTPRTLEERIFDNKTKQFRQGHLLGVANYSPHLEHLLSVFPRHQVLILDGDMMVENPISQLRRIEDFLGLEHKIKQSDIYFDDAKGFYCMTKPTTGEQKCLGGSKGRKHEEINPRLKEKIVNFIRPYNEKFFKLIGQRFDWD